ncbi:fatty acid desaturase [Deminuibacter soli]|uniref:fatty acid desaturase n=1 Tax=Deminuibacter soli TaxID=2291815 RepID=UPI001FE764FC|nr:fatty acid desaturase [Deminuibacter soli]
MDKQTFIYSHVSEPHRVRTKKILQQHPDIRELIGKNPYTIFAIIGLVVFQTALAGLVSGQSWWLVFGAAYLLGAFANHALFVMIHECAHQLLFKGKIANRLAGMFANLPQIFPNSISFERYHIKHHSFQGVHELDGDLPNHWEARLINNYFIGKVMWLLLYPFFQLSRLGRLKEIKAFDKWTVANFIIQVVFTAAMWYFFGFKAIAFMVLSFFFSVGLHPLGARWIQEHYVVKENQETYSYYGNMNKLAFNVGYHNEHHDFPSIPWNKLPQIRSKAPIFYDSLYYHTSWVKLFFRFLFDQEISLFSRIIRNNRGKVPLTDKSKADIEMTQMNAHPETQLAPVPVPVLQ